MHQAKLDKWKHDHIFGQDEKRKGESRTLLVVALTLAMMVVEIVVGVTSGSMALLADGLHMASHAGALLISVLAYVFARRQANNEDYSFGIGKVNALAGYTSAFLLLIFAGIMIYESIMRLVTPTPIHYSDALIVATLGLIVNGASAIILNPEHQHDDHNLNSAYLHVLADALTSLLAIGALVFAKLFGARWMDPAMGIVGGLLVARWCVQLARSSTRVLLDKQVAPETQSAIVSLVEADGDSRVADLHVWSIGPGLLNCVMTIVAHNPLSAADYRKKLDSLNLAHCAIEIHTCVDRAACGNG